LFELFLTKSFATELKKLEKKERERIKQKLSLSCKDPWMYFQRLTRHDLFRIRIGKYRVITQINTRENKITLLSVKHRKKVYKNL